jgi:hypothetical protein
MPQGLELPDFIAHNFRFHSARTPERAAEHQLIRDVMIEAARNVFYTVPEGRERALALTKLEEAMFWANAGIARQGD